MCSSDLAAFGYGKGAYRTDVRDMRRKRTVLFARREFQVEQVDRVTELGLWIDFSDAFVAYVTGHEIARNGVGRSSGRSAQNVKPREQKGRQYFALPDGLKYLKDGANIFTIEGHNSSAEKADFLLDPVLTAED